MSPVPGSELDTDSTWHMLLSKWMNWGNQSFSMSQTGGPGTVARLPSPGSFPLPGVHIGLLGLIGQHWFKVLKINSMNE